MIRKIIHIDKEKCNGCGLCVNACHEGAIGLAEGKAYLLRDDYCDGLGDCLPACPVGAITFTQREAAAYDEEAVQQKKKMKQVEKDDLKVSAEFPGSQPQGTASRNSQLSQWPVQIKLVPVNAPYFNGAHLLIAADCTAYAYAAFHEDFIRGRVTLVGCPKLDDVDYSEKLTEIIKNNDIKDVTIVRMEVPCCGGLEYAAVTAMKNSGKFLPWQVVTISTEGNILHD